MAEKKLRSVAETAGIPDSILDLLSLKSRIRETALTVNMADLLVVQPPDEISRKDVAGLLIKYKILWDAWIWTRRRYHLLRLERDSYVGSKMTEYRRADPKLSVEKCKSLLALEQRWVELEERLINSQTKCDLLEGGVKGMEVKVKHILLYGGKRPEYKDMADAMADIDLEDLMTGTVKVDSAPTAEDEEDKA